MHSEQFHACPAVRDGVVSRLNKPASMQSQQVHKQACQRECASQASGARQVSAPSMKECRVETRVLPSSRRCEYIISSYSNGTGTRRPEISTAAEVPKAHTSTRLTPKVAPCQSVMVSVEAWSWRGRHTCVTQTASATIEMGPSTEASLMKASAHPSHRSSHRSDHRHVRRGTCS